MIMMNLSDNLSVGDAFKVLRGYFESSGVASPALDARLILLDRLEMSHADFISHPERLIEGKEKVLIEQAAHMRIKRQPMSQILGVREFYGREFLVSGGTLTPRPDSEILVETALKALGPEKRPHILDLGTGTGCLLLSLLAEIENSHGVGVDLSQEALEVANKNAALLGLENRSQFLQGNWFDPVEGEFDLIISNPPYIKTDEIAGLQDEVRLYEPHIALDGGVDGLEPYRLIISQAEKHLRKNGKIIFEIGATQKEDVVSLFKQKKGAVSPRSVSCYQDLEGRDRCLYATY